MACSNHVPVGIVPLLGGGKGLNLKKHFMLSHTSPATCFSDSFKHICSLDDPQESLHSWVTCHVRTCCVMLPETLEALCDVCLFVERKLCCHPNQAFNARLCPITHVLMWMQRQKPGEAATFPGIILLFMYMLSNNHVRHVDLSAVELSVLSRQL